MTRIARVVIQSDSVGSDSISVIFANAHGHNSQEPVATIWRFLDVFSTVLTRATRLFRIDIFCSRNPTVNLPKR